MIDCLTTTLSTLKRSALLCVTLLVTSAVGSSPAASEDRASPSHLLFYLAVEKQLIPQTADLADRARHLLSTQCGQLSECFSEAESLKDIPTLKSFPSDRTLQREGSKVFTKHLLKESYTNLQKMEILLKQEQGDSQPLQDLVENMSQTRQQLKQELEAHFKVKLDGRKYKSLLRTKSRYLKSTSATDRAYRVRLLYTAYTRLLKIGHVLGYAVKLSWVALENKEWFSTPDSATSPL